MTINTLLAAATFTLIATQTMSDVSAQIGRRFPSETKVVQDPVTGVPLRFLTSTPAGDRKIYPTHPQWTADGKWVIFRSIRAAGQAMAVNEETGELVQVTETGYQGALCVGQKSMRLFLMRQGRKPIGRMPTFGPLPFVAHETCAHDASMSQTETLMRREDHAAPGARTGDRASQTRSPLQVVAIDLARVFADSATGRMQPADSYETVFGTIPLDIGGGGELAIDATEEVAYFRMQREAAARLLPEGTKIDGNFGPRNLGAGPTGIAKMNLDTGEVTPVVAVPFQVGHVQSNRWVPGEVVFCWETGGKAPQRTWMVRADGTGLRAVYPESPFDWVTHEVVISRDEVAFAIMGNRRPDTDDAWGPSGTRVHPTGLGIVNLRTREMTIAGQTKSGSGFWHVHGSPDGRWAVGDDFARNVWLIDRRTSEMILLTTGHKVTASDHVHPSFHPDGTRIQFQSAMLSKDNRSMNICIAPVPKAWLERTYSDNVQPAR